MGKRKLGPSENQSDSKILKLSAFGFKTQNQENSPSPSVSEDNVSEKCELSVSKPLTPSNRKFQPSWKFDRPWLTYDASQKLMFCDICVKAQVRNTFTIGCHILKKDQLIKHVEAKGDNSHAAALLVTKESISMEKARQTAMEKGKDAIISAIRNVYFCASHNLSNSTVPHLNQLCIDQGATQLRDLKCDAHTSYSHNSSVQEFQHSMAQVLQDRLVDRVIESGIFSVCLDESTDVSVHNNLVVYIRYLTKACGRVEPCTDFLGIRQLSVANAESITSELLSLLEEKGLSIDGLVGMSTDGASVMTGCRSGVVSRVKEIKSDVLATHCIAHRLALGSGGAADKVRYLLKFQEILNSMFQYFDRSPKNMARLEGIQALLEETRGTRLKQVSHTRWLSFEGSVQSVVDNFGSIVSVFLEDNSAKAMAMYKPITTYKFLYVAHFLADVLRHLAILCKAFQKSDLMFTDVDPLLRSTVEIIQELGDKKSGPYLRRFLDETPVSPQVGSCGAFTFEFKGHIIRDGSNYRSESVSACEEFVENVVKNLKDRFTEKGDTVVLGSLTRLFDPIQVSDRESVVLKEAVGVISGYLVRCGLGSEVEIRHELESFLAFGRIQVVSNRSVFLSTSDVIQLAIRNRTTYPVVSAAAERLLVMPVSTVECERGFSKQNLIKTDLRNALSIRSLENLMRISITDTCTESFEYEKAFKLWAANKSRRILTSRF